MREQVKEILICGVLVFIYDMYMFLALFSSYHNCFQVLFFCLILKVLYIFSSVPVENAKFGKISKFFSGIVKFQPEQDGCTYKKP